MLTINEKGFFIAVVLLFVQAELHSAEKRVGIFFIDLLKDWSFTVKGIRLLIILELHFNFIFLH
jgi:hypothetical protein